MKKLILLFSIILFASCDKSIDEDCGCVKETYQRVAYVCFDDVTNLPKTCYNMKRTTVEDVNCQQDAGTYPTQNGSYYIIKCN